MKTILISILIFSLFCLVVQINYFIKNANTGDFNYKKQKALHTIKNKEEYTKIQIQKAQQYLDVDAIATNFNRNLKQ